MPKASIPVDLFNPGQVFACLGFLEAADLVCGDAEGWFDWRDEAEVRFRLRAAGDDNPFEAVLEFLATAEAIAVAPEGWRPKKRTKTPEEKGELQGVLHPQKRAEVFPAPAPDTSSAMPIQIANSKVRIILGHWTDGSGRNQFKLYAGNRSALDIATAMISGTSAKPKKGQNVGVLKTRGITQLWRERKEDLIGRPLEITTSMSGSFNFDPRGAWTTIDAGYSPNTQKHQVEASPVVELLAAWGLEHARPDEFDIRKVRYAAWGLALPPMLARVALVGGIAVVPMKRFRFELRRAGRNKVITFAEQETTYD